MTDISSGTLETGSGFSLGNVIERSFGILGRNLVPFLVLSGIAAIPYIWYFWSIDAAQFAEPGTALAPAARARLVFESFGISSLIGFVLSALIKAVILFGAFQDMRGQKFQIGASLQKGLARFVPILGLLIVEGAGVILGFILLIVPGLILQIMWFVALPACVVEKTGPIASLGRSAALTKGSRWKIFGTVLLIGIVVGILNAVVSGVLTATHIRIALVIGQYAFQTVSIAFTAIVGVVIYHDLRVAKEGIDTDRIAAVFD
jgi:hypothetical protein